MFIMGIDTSAYTTSVAIIDGNKTCVWEKRELLKTPAGERGLAQSEAFFQHIQSLPKILEEVPSTYWSEMKAIGVSASPRSVEGSYMPVFTAGLSIASALSSALSCRLIQVSHQEGHLAAGLISAEGLCTSEFLAVHLSGGTTELLKVKSLPGEYQMTILGETTDLHAGQFVDRIGVRLGLSFPAGKEMEKLAQNAAPGSASLLPSAVNGCDMSFSGVESAAQRLIEANKRPADIARAVEGCIVRTLYKVLERAVLDTGIRDILIVGGVASNSYIRQDLARKMNTTSKLYWAKPDWSSDNAIGVAILALESIE